MMPAARRGTCDPADSNLGKTPSVHAGMVKVYVKKEGAEADTPFWPGDTVELLRLVAEEFGAAGRLKTTDGGVIGTAFPLEEGATLTWHPSTGGECGHV